MSLSEIVGHIDDPEERADAAARIRHELGRRIRSAALARVPRITRTEKRCPTCQEVKPASEFWRNTSRPDGLQSECRACR